jgi:DNA mismatch repair ATPase MutL
MLLQCNLLHCDGSMPIVPLPDSTVRAIGSSLVLNDACSVVKELVDNALDAIATSVTVEISLDALDIIQVKDNGQGIGIEDRQLVCKRGCTSKIRTFEDLDKLGGSFLGFRGEALASVAELSEAVALTTRVDGEVVGTTLKFGRDGSLQK